jgi:hypothetical protein
MPCTAKKFLTTAEAARLIGCPEWCVARAFLRGLLPEPERLGRSRLIREDQLPQLHAALVDAGYLREDNAHGPDARGS